MIHVVVTKRLIGLPLLIHIDLLWRSRGWNRNLKIEESESELLSTDSTALVVNTTPRPLYLRERDPVPIVQEAGGPQGQSGRVRKTSPSPGFEPLTVHPVTSRYTDWAIPAPCSVKRTTHFYLLPRLWMSGAVPQLPLLPSWQVQG
jgi:hypothetical protein